MNCKKFETLIALYVEGDLRAQKTRAVERHLLTCSSCCEFARELRLSQTALKSLGLDRAPDASLDRVRARVLGSISIERPAISRRARRYAIAAGVAIMIAIAVAGLRREQNDKVPMRDSAALSRLRQALARPSATQPLFPATAQGGEGKILSRLSRARPRPLGGEGGEQGSSASRREPVLCPPKVAYAPELQRRSGFCPQAGEGVIARRSRLMPRAGDRNVRTAVTRIPDLLARRGGFMPPFPRGQRKPAASVAPETEGMPGRTEKACQQQSTELRCMVRNAQQPRLPEEKVKLVTSDPNIVIYMILD